MARYALSTLLALASSTYVVGQSVSFPATPLADKSFAYPTQVPYKVDTDTGGRGPQAGYNQCNSTTEGGSSQCQTSFVSTIDDFCLWAPATPDSTIADTEGEEVAWCTRKGHGTRIIPEGALQGVQYIKTGNYIQIAGFIDQTLLNMQGDDFGGELDPHGQDLRGNPIGGLMYSTGYSKDNNTYVQMHEWNSFIGGGTFCITVCPDDGTAKNAAGYCRNTLDRLGCAVNSPNNAQKGVYEVCQGEDKDLPGVYTSNGQTITYSQPDESLGPITTLPFTVRTPASSNCQTFSSAALFADAPAPTGSAPASSAVTVTSAVSSVAGAPSGSGAAAASGATPAGSGAASTPTGAKPASSAPSNSPSRSGSAGSAAVTGAASGAVSTGVSVFAAMAGVAFSVAFLA